MTTTCDFDWLIVRKVAVSRKREVGREEALVGLCDLAEKRWMIYEVGEKRLWGRRRRSRQSEC